MKIALRWAWGKANDRMGQPYVAAAPNLTNGLLESTTHRVVNPDNDRARRFSMLLDFGRTDAIGIVGSMVGRYFLLQCEGSE